MFTLLLALSTSLWFCAGKSPDKTVEQVQDKNMFLSLFDTTGRTVEERFPTLEGYHRVPVQTESFGHYLRNLPLKPHGSMVRYYDNTQKANLGVYAAVVDLPIGKKDLHQCADAIMRLRAEYLWKAKRYSEIHFNFTNGFRCDYDRWRKGDRIRVDGNNVYWVSGGTASDSYEVFWSYMEMVFSYAGTLSLSRELRSVPVSEMQIGDLFIRGGSPGHAVIVVDMASDSAGNKMFMLAQSYMPAQETQILYYPSSVVSVWYPLDFGPDLRTPEWRFTSDQLMRF